MDERRCTDVLMDFWEGIFTEAHRRQADELSGDPQTNIVRTDHELRLYTEGNVVGVRFPQLEVFSEEGSFQFELDDPEALLIERTTTLLSD